MIPGPETGHGRGHGRPYLRQLALFLLAVLLPASALIVLSLRTVAQERELARNRGRDERERAARHFGQELFRELESLARHPQAAGAQTVMAAPADGDTLVLPWECQRPGPPSAGSDGGGASDAGLWEAERLEFGAADVAAAAGAYRQAVAAARDAGGRGRALLGLARSLARAGEASAARQALVEVLELPATVRDEFGVPLSLYAAARLAAGGDAAGGLPAARAVAESSTLMSPAALHIALQLVRDAMGSAAVEAAPDAAGLLPQLQARAAEAQQARALKSDFRAVRALIDPGATRHAGRRWALYGRLGWLVGLVHREAGGEPTLHAVRADEISRRAFREGGFERLGYAAAELSPGADGVWLGDAFPGVRVRFTPAPGAEAAGARSGFYWALVSAVLGVTLFGAYLWWRDTRRELKLAGVRSDFVSGVSHELKTPLTSIRMFAETLRCRSPSEQQRHEYLDTIVSESERLSRLLANVLDFSRIERDVKRYDLQPAELSQVVRSALRAMQQPIREGGFRVELIAPAQPVPLQADRDALEQALINLLGNAIKYSGHNSLIEVLVGVESGSARVVVQDHGLGIHPRHQPHLFDRYYRAPEAHNARIPGTGLGLSIVKHIVEGHGGRITVESSPGQGAAFTLWLPMEGAS